MNIKYIYLIFLYKLIIQIVLNQRIPPRRGNNNYIVSLNDEILNNLNPPWGTSSFTKAYKYGLEFIFNPMESTIIDQNPSNVTIEQDYIIDLKYEAYGVVMSYLNVFRNQFQRLRPRSDLVIKASINEKIIPRNYFNNLDYVPLIKLNNTETLMECQYTNPGPSFTTAKLKKVSIDSVIVLRNKNFGLKRGEKGIKIITMDSNFALIYENLDDFIRRNTGNSNFILTDNIQFTDLFINYNITKFPETDFVVTAVCENQTIYIYNVTDREVDDFRITQYDIIKNDVHNTEIKKIIVDGDKILISSKNSGFSILVKDAGWKHIDYTNFYGKNNKTVTLVLNDFIVVKSTVYMIIDKFGMVTYNLNTLSFNTGYFEHPKMKSLDHTTFLQLNYIGVVIDNDPPSIPEFFIEFVHNENNPNSPLINKVFISRNSYDIKDIATDNQLGLTYILDHKTNILIIITRTVANLLESYNYQIQFDEYHIFNSTRDIPLFMIAENNSFFPSLVIQDGDDYIVFGRFFFPETQLNCNFKFNGTYLVQFNALQDCSHFNSTINLFNYRSCSFNNNYLIKVSDNLSLTDKLKNLSDWIAFGVLLTISCIAILITVFCCRKRCFKSNSKDVRPQYIQQKSPDELEVRVMEKNSKI